MNLKFLGIVDFDLETYGDPSQHAEYVLQTFQYYKVTFIQLQPPEKGSSSTST